MEKTSDTLFKIAAILAGTYLGYWYCMKVKETSASKKILGASTSLGVRG